MPAGPQISPVKPVGFRLLLRLLLLMALVGAFLLSGIDGPSSVIRLERDANRDTSPVANGAVWRVRLLTYFKVTLAIG